MHIDALFLCKNGQIPLMDSLEYSCFIKNIIVILFHTKAEKFKVSIQDHPVWTKIFQNCHTVKAKSGTQQKGVVKT